jgi:hypothetical protein
MSKKVAAQAPPPTMAPEAEEFMALLLYAQKEPCNCIFAQYFKRMGERLIRTHIKKEGESSG